MSPTRIKGFRYYLRCAPVTGLLLFAAPLTGWCSPTLLDRSPFVPANFDPGSQNVSNPAAPTSSTGYEFRGVYQIGDRYWFLVSDPASQDGSWIELGKTSEDLLARSFDPETKSLVLVSNNTEHKLELASVEANPTPIPVKGLVKSVTRTPTKTPTPVRRTIRPTSSVTNGNTGNRDSQRTAAPPPAWLEKLRAEAAERRARGQQDQGDRTGNNRRSITPNRPTQQSSDARQAPSRAKPPQGNNRSR